MAGACPESSRGSRWLISANYPELISKLHFQRAHICRHPVEAPYPGLHFRCFAGSDISEPIHHMAKLDRVGTAARCTLGMQASFTRIYPQLHLRRLLVSLHLSMDLPRDARLRRHQCLRLLLAFGIVRVLFGIASRALRLALHPYRTFTTIWKSLGTSSCSISLGCSGIRPRPHHQFSVGSARLCAS